MFVCFSDLYISDLPRINTSHSDHGLGARRPWVGVKAEQNKRGRSRASAFFDKKKDLICHL